MANWQAVSSEDTMNEFFKQHGKVDRRVIEWARPVLTPEQLTAFPTHQTNQLQMHRLGMRMASTMFGA